MRVKRCIKMALILIVLAVSLIILGKSVTAEMNNNYNEDSLIVDLIPYYSKLYNVPIPLIDAIINNESTWEVYSSNESDPSYGLMGVEPVTFYDYNRALVSDYKNPTSDEINRFYVPLYNLGAGCKLLGHLFNKYPNQLDAVVQMYNVGENGYQNLGYRNSAYSAKVLKDYYVYLGDQS